MAFSCHFSLAPLVWNISTVSLYLLLPDISEEYHHVYFLKRIFLILVVWFCQMIAHDLIKAMCSQLEHYPSQALTSGCTHCPTAPQK